MQNYFENDFTQYMLVDNIVHIIYKKGVFIDLQASKRIVRDRLMFQEERAYPVICDIRQLRKVDKAARDYLALEGSLLIKALAFIIEPPVSDVMTRFYLMTNHPDIPTASFREISKALAYLGRFIGMVMGLSIF
ncbi:MULTISPECIES: hypothetical protein [unclassified Arenibacter]|jgi:hypothetical protein|uniref:DUF7793 family protein n=1 Tax=unclassified Arenibacter TaxID=2615047 RepID=UPI000E34A47B|nr:MULTISPECIES: hypothetical protein [unclassified Arenibacter]MCM4164814.1 hypothetical protein [Arenibacter sp. A80]RFT55235.1 hypothetical protein D0S24_14510 [Arenibacter sp. P308M17]